MIDRQVRRNTVRVIIQVVVVLLYTLLVGAAAFADDYNDGVKAYKEGDYKTAHQLYLKAAKEGNAAAQRALGFMYLQSHGVSMNFEEAARWFRLAAEQGDSYAQNTLGVLYHQGLGVPRDDKEAVKWYRLSAEQGDATAQDNLGTMCEYGQGVLKDYKEALKWYRLAAAQGYASAQIHLGNVYAFGKGVPQDDKEAVVTVVAIGADNMVTIRTDSGQTLKVKALNAKDLKVGDRKEVRIEKEPDLTPLPRRN